MSKDSIEFVANKKLKGLIEPIIKDVKEKYTQFYSANIGNIDKTKPVDLNTYVVMQNKAPLGDATIKLNKNYYVLQKELDNKEYIYIPFKKTTSTFIPYKDDEAMKELTKAYSTYKPLRKKALLERIYEKNKDELKKKKITKKYFNSVDIEELSSELESLGINDLSQALNFYIKKDITKISMKRNINHSIVESSSFYDRYKQFINSLDNAEAHDIFSQFSKLNSLLDDEISCKHSAMHDGVFDENFVTKTTTQDIECVSIPKADYILEAFFEKKLDVSKINSEVRRGKLDLELKNAFEFYEPCSNLSELVDRLNTLDFVKSKAFNTIDFEESETIILN